MKKINLLFVCLFAGTFLSSLAIVRLEANPTSTSTPKPTSTPASNASLCSSESIMSVVRTKTPIQAFLYCQANGCATCYNDSTKYQTQTCSSPVLAENCLACTKYGLNMSYETACQTGTSSCQGYKDPADFISQSKTALDNICSAANAGAKSATRQKECHLEFSGGSAISVCKITWTYTFNNTAYSVSGSEARSSSTYKLAAMKMDDAYLLLMNNTITSQGNTMTSCNWTNIGWFPSNNCRVVYPPFPQST